MGVGHFISRYNKLLTWNSIISPWCPKRYASLRPSKQVSSFTTTDHHWGACLSLHSARTPLPQQKTFFTPYCRPNRNMSSWKHPIGPQKAATVTFKLRVPNNHPCSGLDNLSYPHIKSPAGPFQQICIPSILPVNPVDHLRPHKDD